MCGGLLFLVPSLTQRGAYVKTHGNAESIGNAGNAESVKSAGNVESARNAGNARTHKNARNAPPDQPANMTHCRALRLNVNV